MARSALLSFERAGEATLIVRLSGTWTLRAGHPAVAEVAKQMGSGDATRQVAFDTRELQTWDSSVLTFVTKITELCRAHGVAIDRQGLPPGVRRLLDLAEAVPERRDARRQPRDTSLVERIGGAAIGTAQGLVQGLNFLGDMTVAFFELFRMRARYRASDLLLLVQECGANALPIVTLISFLVGVIFAFVGAVQLKQFGAQIYVADLVAIAMVREMGAMMTAILMAGRTGAAFAAQLGTMKVTQEIDAFVASGFSPMEFLVLPRVIALVLMLPLLCAYSDFIGILGGAVIGWGMLDLPWSVYLRETANAVTLTDVFGGVFKSSVYGVLIALSGCLRGLQSGRSSSAVGDAATSAVVTGIVAIIVACGVFAVCFYILGI